MINLSCRFCDYKSTRRCNIKRHENSKHSDMQIQTEEELICKFCDRTFSTKHNCIRHMVAYCKNKCKTQDVNIKTQNVNVLTQNVNSITQNVNIETQNVNSEHIKHHNDTKLTCDLCNKQFTRQWNLTRHMANCKGVSDPYQCYVCRHTFSSSASKSRHMKTCKAVIQPESTTTSLSPQTTNIDTQINNVTNQNANTINNNKITINVNLNNFGEESLDHITPDMLTRFAKEINNGLAKLIDTIHFNPDAPQNHNIRLENVKGQLVAVYQNNEWTIRDMNDAVTNMISNGCRLLTDHYYNTEHLQKEDAEKHYGVIQKKLSSIGCKDRNSYFPTKRLVIASLHNQRNKQVDNMRQIENNDGEVIHV